MTTKKQNTSKRDQSISVENGGVYEIKIKGHLDEHWKQWFEGMELGNVTNGETGQECTLLTGHIVDQPALHGLLAKIRDLNLTLISVRKMNPKDPVNEGKDRDDANEKNHQ
jgi:hypothetical protein